MKSRIHLLVLAVSMLISAPLLSQQYLQYFDGADTSAHNSLIIDLDTSASNIWQIGPPQKALFDSASTLPNGIVTDTLNPYPNANISIFSFGIPKHFQSFTIAAIKWVQKLDMDSMGDGGFVEFSTDSGKTWQNAFDNPYVYNFYGFDAANVDTIGGLGKAFTGTDSGWKEIWLCFDLSWMNTGDSMRLRYVLRSDTIGNNGDGWLMDNFRAEPTFTHTVKKVATTEFLEIYPNPVSNRLHLQVNRDNEFERIEGLRILDMQGRIIRSYGPVPTKFFVDLAGEQPGTYLLQLKANHRTETIAFVLE